MPLDPRAWKPARLGIEAEESRESGLGSRGFISPGIDGAWCRIAPDFKPRMNSRLSKKTR